MNKIKYDYDYSNILLPQKFSTNEKISLSQGKSYKNSFNKELIKPENNTFYNMNLKVVHNNKYNDYNKNTNLMSLLNKGYSTNGFKFLYKKDDKYNYKINTNYIKEQNKNILIIILIMTKISLMKKKNLLEMIAIYMVIKKELFKR